MGYIDFTEEHYLASPRLYRRWMTDGDMEHGDVLITTEAPLGNVAAVPDSRKYILSQRTVLLRPGGECFDKKYFMYALQSPGFQRLLAENATGSTALGIKRKRLEQLAVPMPTIGEQERIAEVLVDTDNLIASLERLIAKKRVIKQGMMQELLTGRTRLPVEGLAL
ncbi:MAG: restriction endonuclease subunit S [Chloroflexota bacterium]|nr:restriction endonuclease subunit S [Chloroflexota bacterium]